MKHRQQASKNFVLLLQAVGLLLTLVSSFLGALYIFNGSLFIAFLLSMIIVVAMFYLVSYFIKEKMNKKLKGYPPMTYYLFIVYGLFSMVVSFFVIHCVNVEFFEKDEIKRIGLNKLNGLDVFYKTYDLSSQKFCDLKKTNISTLVVSNPDKLLGKPYNLLLDDIKAINNLDPVEQETYINDNIMVGAYIYFKYEKMKIQADSNYISQSRNVIENWDRINVSSTLKELNSRIIEDHEKLSAILKTKCEPMLYKKLPPQIAYLEESLIDKPLVLASKHLGAATLFTLLAFQLMILLPYFITRSRQFGSN
jgi:hypothetical protein